MIYPAARPIGISSLMLQLLLLWSGLVVAEFDITMLAENRHCSNHKNLRVYGVWDVGGSLLDCAQVVSEQSICIGDRFHYHSDCGDCGCSTDACDTRTADTNWDLYTYTLSLTTTPTTATATATATTTTTTTLTTTTSASTTTTTITTLTTTTSASTTPTPASKIAGVGPGITDNADKKITAGTATLLPTSVTENTNTASEAEAEVALLQGSKKGAGGIAAGVLIAIGAVGAGIWYRCQGIRSQQHARADQNFLEREASRNVIPMETNPLSANAGATGGATGGAGAGVARPGVAPVDGMYYSEIAANIHQQDADGHIVCSTLAATAATESIVYATYARSPTADNENVKPYTAPNDVDVAMYAKPLDVNADATPYATSHPEALYSPNGDGGVAYASSI